MLIEIKDLLTTAELTGFDTKGDLINSYPQLDGVTYDVALPQEWLNSFGKDYYLVRSFTVWVYSFGDSVKLITGFPQPLTAEAYWVIHAKYPEMLRGQ